MRCDCHLHLFDPARFPYRDGVIYTPAAHETATFGQLDAVLNDHGFSHGVLVQPMAGYQNDNACLLDGLTQGAGRFCGIAIVEADVADAELDRLAAAGVVGARIDLIARGAGYMTGEGKHLLERLAERGWIIDIQSENDQLAEAAPALAVSRARLLIDHVGRPDPAAGVKQSGFMALLALAEAGKTWVKLSGPFRHTMAEDWSDVAPFWQALMDRVTPERLVWGSDWPFVRMPTQPSYNAALAWFERCVPDADDRKAILSTTPAALFGFTR